MSQNNQMKRAVEAWVHSLHPLARVLSIEPLAPDRAVTDETGKVAGYGAPLLIQFETEERKRHCVVLRTATSNDFGHDRRSDRAQQLLLAYDTFGDIPAHVRPIDVGAIGPAGELISLRHGDELYLVTTYAPGRLYVEDLRRIATTGVVEPLDVQRVEALARYLVSLHRQRGERPECYRRAIRDLLGHGEGIFGMVDGYPSDTAAAPPSRLQAIEERCLVWRWRLRGYEHRLRRTHGDFHPFNLVFEGGVHFAVLDASRGGQGDPADDVSAMAINFIFFALDHLHAWRNGLGRLWDLFWTTYLADSGDTELLEVVAPFLAWRGLVVSNPLFYPAFPGNLRNRLLTFVERTLDQRRFEIASAHELFG